MNSTRLHSLTQLVHEIKKAESYNAVMFYEDVSFLKDYLKGFIRDPQKRF